ncbi:MAG: hypothetical protein IPI01_19075 [Ignavibacteriae bacterium]|nr:hypothetical protein [Ignavibacteriota bacterium]
MVKPTNDEVQRNPDHIDQIRDIIMGPQKRDMDQRHDRLAADLRRHQDDTTTHLDEIRSQINAEVARLSKTMQQNRADLEDALATKVRELASVQEDHRQELAALRTKFQNDLRTTREQLAGELERNITALRDTTVARERLAELLQEVALKLRNDAVLEEFSNAMRPGEGS